MMKIRREYDRQGEDTVKALIAALAISLLIFAMNSRMQPQNASLPEDLSMENAIARMESQKEVKLDAASYFGSRQNQEMADYVAKKIQDGASFMNVHVSSMESR